MSPNKFDPQEWGRRLDAGEQNDSTLLLAVQLEKNRPDSRPFPPLVKTDLRRRLIAKAAAVPVRRLDYWAASLAMTALLIILAALIWSLRSDDPPTAAATQDTELIASSATEPRPSSPQVDTLPEYWELRQVRQSVDGDHLTIQATLAYTLAAPATATFFLAPVNWPNAGVRPQEVLGTFALDAATTSAAGDEMAVQFTIDPLVIWEQFNSFDLVLAVQLERETADGPVVFSTSDQQLTLRAEWLDQVWLISVTPEPGTPLDKTAFTVALGYRLLSAPAADIRLLVAAPGWENAMGSGRLPTNGAGDPVTVSRGEGVLTFIFTTEDAAYLHTLLGDEATLAVTMLSPGEDGTLRALTQQTFSQFRWPVVAADQPPDRLWFVSVSPEPGATIREGDTIIVTVGYELYSAVEGSLYLSLVNATWEGDRPPEAALGGQNIMNGTGEIEFQFTADDLPVLQAWVGEYGRLTVRLSTTDAQQQYRELIAAAWDGTPWRLGETMIGIPRIPPQVTILLQNESSNVTTRLEILSIQFSAASAEGMTPIIFTVQLAYGLAARHAEEASLMIWIMPEGGGVSQVLVGEVVQAGAGIMEATFTFNPQRDLYEILRQPRRYQLMFSINKVDDSNSPFLTNLTTQPDWEFRP